MKEIEITEIPALKPNEQSLLELHSLLNILNVLRGELSLIGLALTGEDTLLRQSLALCTRLVESLRSLESGLSAARQIDAHERAVLGEIEEALQRHPEGRNNSDVAESMANLVSVFSILRVRARELLARVQYPERWERFSAAALQRNFLEVFSAIEKNSRHRFRIIYNAALQRPNDYYFDLKIESAEGDGFWMPPVLHDVMRDLTANARKYTAPGGHITAALHADTSGLRFVVEDTGRGIPPDELAAVVQFGRRATNVGDVRTMGGGFGLTKAFFVTKQFGGRFWIASELGRGTRIRLEVPRPPGALAAPSELVIAAKPLGEPA